jgi:hypothetical protein
VSWDNVPWFVGGGAEHSPEVARLMAYVAFRGNEGVLAAGDLKVTALAIPGGAVRVAPGACSILNRATGGAYQAYAGRLPSEDSGVSVPPTGAGAGRSDLVVARVEDPFLPGEPWADPSDPKVGPYIYTRVIPNVPSSTTSVAGLGLGYSAIALARIDLPATTGTVTDAMIVDLRKIANPRRERAVFTTTQGSSQALSSASFVSWPSAGSWSVTIPGWATQAIIRGNVGGVPIPALSSTAAGTVYGQLRASLGGTATNWTPWDETVPAGANVDRKFWACADTITIPAAARGTTATIRLEALRSGGNVNPTADARTSATIDVEFVEGVA